MARRGSLARLARPGTRPYSAAARSTPGWRAWPCLRLRALHLLSGRVALPVKLHSWAALGGAPCSRVSVCPRASGPETWRKRWSRRRRCRRVAPHRRARSAGCFSCHRACHRRRVPWVCATSSLTVSYQGGAVMASYSQRGTFFYGSPPSLAAPPLALCPVALPARGARKRAPVRPARRTAHRRLRCVRFAHTLAAHKHAPVNRRCWRVRQPLARLCAARRAPRVRCTQGYGISVYYGNRIDLPQPRLWSRTSTSPRA